MERRWTMVVPISVVAAGLVIGLVAAQVFFSDVLAPRVSGNEFQRLVESTNTDTLGSICYKGRKNGCDYFKLRWNAQSRVVKVAVEESPVERSYPHTMGKRGWRSACFMHLEGDALREAMKTELNGS